MRNEDIIELKKCIFSSMVSIFLSSNLNLTFLFWLKYSLYSTCRDKVCRQFARTMWLPTVSIRSCALYDVVNCLTIDTIASRSYFIPNSWRARVHWYRWTTRSLCAAAIWASSQATMSHGATRQPSAQWWAYRAWRPTCPALVASWKSTSTIRHSMASTSLIDALRAPKSRVNSSASTCLTSRRSLDVSVSYREIVPSA